MTASERPVCILIAALGGEGGGVLTQWLVDAASRAGYPVQSTSIPGVAQRTGATTYYIEIYPVPAAELGDKRPVFALYPAPGSIDVMIASEWLEVARALEAGYASPDRTTLIGSTHRIYAINERAAMGDGRYRADTIRDAAERFARRLVLDDFAVLARENGSPLNAVLLGALAGSGVTTLEARAFEESITASGIAVDQNLAGFRAGLARAQQTDPSGPEPIAPGPAPGAGDAGLAAEFPPEVRPTIEAGMRRLSDYQDAAYARQYGERLKPIVSADVVSGSPGYALTRETARQLALWMSYEDVIRVADLKIRAGRRRRLRSEVEAGTGEPVRVTEFLKPGVDEIASVLPPAWGRWLIDWSARHGYDRKLQFSMRVNTHTVLGYLRLSVLARLRGRRRRTLRFAEESRAIGEWLGAIERAAPRDYDLALEIAHCASLLKGYSDTYRRGRRNYRRLFGAVIQPALDGAPLTGAAERLRQARAAALQDPDGRALEAILGDAPVTTS